MNDVKSYMGGTKYCGLKMSEERFTEEVEDRQKTIDRMLLKIGQPNRDLYFFIFLAIYLLILIVSANYIKILYNMSDLGYFGIIVIGNLVIYIILPLRLCMQRGRIIDAMFKMFDLVEFVGEVEIEKQ